MQNPFRKLFKSDTTSDTAKKDLHKQITKKAWEISKSILHLKFSQINELEKLYIQYFALYPDAKGEANSKDRIKKLKTMVK